MKSHWRSVGVRVGMAACVVLAAGSASADDEARAGAGDDLPAVERTFDLAGWLDGRFEEIWRENGVEPRLCGDATYLRRVYLDLAGRIPSVPETRDFLSDGSPGKRAELVDRLLVDSGNSGRNRELFAEHQARIWRRIMFPPGSTGAAMGPALDAWLEDQFRENVPYDEMVRRLLAAQEEDDAAGAQMFYAAAGGTPDASATAVTRVFLGVRLGCAQCHPHPFADWDQDDFWGMAAFFVGSAPGRGDDGVAQSDPTTSASITYEGTTYPAKYLWDEARAELSEGVAGPVALAEWMTARGNPTFAATAVNRVWQHLLGRGLVFDADELDMADEEIRELVLDDLAVMFEESGYDLRWLVAGIVGSKVYQCVSERREGEEASLYAGTRPLKTLTPEQVFDSLEQALMLPVSQSSDEAARYNGQMAQMVQRLDESAGGSPEEYAAGVPQVLMLMNGRLTADATDLETSRTLRAVVDSPFLNSEEKIETLFLAALTRFPSEAERATLLRHIESQPNEAARRAAYGELLWALINSPEFVLCR